MTKNKRRGLMLVLSSPSGAGKSTLSKLLLESEHDLVMSTSATTRKPRPGEVDGQHYYFMTQEVFDDLADNDGFLEYATVFGNSYGTPRKKVEEALEAGNDILFDIDWQGTQQLVQKAGSDLVRIFILPPSIPELERRLYTRGQDSEDVINGRMAEAASEISHWAEYDYVLINNDLDECLKEIQTILTVERKRKTRQTGLTQFVRSLMSKAKETYNI